MKLDDILMLEPSPMNGLMKAICLISRINFPNSCFDANCNYEMQAKIEGGSELVFLNFSRLCAKFLNLINDQKRWNECYLGRR